MYLSKKEASFLLHTCREELAYRKKQLIETKKDKDPFIHNGINMSVKTVELEIKGMEDLIKKITHDYQTGGR